MRKIVLAVAIWAVVVPATIPAAHAGDGAISFGRRALHREWVAWAAGSNTNPLVDPAFCGEIVDGRFFLNLAGVLEGRYDCEIPAGVTIVASAGYAIFWKPTDARSDQRLRHLVNQNLQHFGPPHGRLDGEVVDLGPSFAKTNVYRIAVGEDSLLQTADPDFPDGRTHTKVAAGAWVFKVSSLAVGDHRLAVRQRVFGNRAKAIFRITITS